MDKRFEVGLVVDFAGMRNTLDSDSFFLSIRKSPSPSFDESFRVNGTGLELVEAVSQRMFQPIKVEISRATLVRTV